jgi:hypothetical protein
MGTKECFDPAIGTEVFYGAEKIILEEIKRKTNEGDSLKAF